jgi:hypothetical protein
MYHKQLEIESTYSKSNIHQWIRAELMSDVVFTDLYIKTVEVIENFLSLEYYQSKQARIERLKLHNAEDIAIDLFHSVLSITEATAPIQAIATQLGLNYFDTQLDAVKTGAELLGACKDLDIYTVHSGGKSFDDLSYVKPNYSLDDDTLYKIHLTQYLPPMLVAPREWSTNTNGGHLLSNSSCILGNGNDVDQNQSYDVLNMLQAIPWKLNTSMLIEPELMKKPSDYEDSRKVRQHNSRCNQSKRIYSTMLEEGNHFYFAWKYDKRGRMYSQGYDINLQGSQYKKAILEFANEELITGV